MSEPYIGEIRSFAFVPDRVDWAPCEGQYMGITGPGKALFSLIDYTYGGDARKGFRLPDLRGRVMVGRGTAVTGSEYALGVPGGAEEVVLDAGTLPEHNHRWWGEDQSADAPGPNNHLMGISSASSRSALLYSATANNRVQLAADTIGPNAGGRAHPNVQPYVAIGYYICLNGIYPPHP